jgi:DUF4097 and DUF4098 domain-containing protein YvlB
MKNRPVSLVGALTLIAVGMLFLLGNVFPELRPWRLIARLWANGWWWFARFWPVIIIVWGLIKLVSYLRSGQDPAAGRRSILSGGDVVLLIFLLIFGVTATNLTKAFRGSWDGAGREDGFRFGDDDFDLLNSGRRFEFTEEERQPLSGTNIPLEIANQFGSVEILVHNLPEIRVRLVKRVKAEDETRGREIADRLKIVIDRKEAGYAVSTNRSSLSQAWRKGLQTNFTVWVPKPTALTVSNRYGSVSLDGISGNQHVGNEKGPVTATNVEGTVRVENKYGPVRLSSITGDCRVENKYGPVEIESVGGRTDIENAYGPVDLKGLKGPVTLSNRYGHVVCTDLASTLSVNGMYVDVRGQNIAGDVEVTTSYKDVELENVQGGIIVRGKHGDIDIKTAQPPVRPILVEAEYSGVEITLPRESQFELDASSKYGKFVSGFDSVNLHESSAGKSLRVKGSAGRGGPTITITTSYRDIALNAS